MFLPAILAFIVLAFVIGLVVLGGSKRLAGRELRISRRSFLYAMAIPLVVGLVFLGLGTFLEWHHTPGFCGDLCHSMGPYYVTYNEPANNSMLVTHPDEHVTCADCHTGPGWSGFLGSFLAVPREVVSETFNLYEPGKLHADVPNDWCTKCHDNVTAGRPGEVKAPGNVSVDPHGTMDRCTDCHLTHRPGLGISVDTCGLCHGMDMPDWDASQAAHGERAGGECLDCHDRLHPEEARIPWEEAPGIDMGFCSDCHQASYGLYTTTSTEGSLQLYGDCMDCHVEHRTSESPHDVEHPYDDCTHCHPTAGERGGIHYRTDVDYLGVPGVKDDLCEPCHGPQFETLVSDHSKVACTSCHSNHGLRVEFEDCWGPCHDEPTEDGHDTGTTGCTKGPCHGTGWYHG